MKRILFLLAVIALATASWAETDLFVGDDQPGAQLRFDNPTFAPEGLCPSNRATRPGCAFKLLLGQVDDRKVTPSTKRKEYRMAPGEYVVYVTNKPLGSYSSQRGRRGENILSYKEHGFPGRIEMDLKDGEVYQIYARRIEKTEANPYGWETVVNKTN